MTPQQTNVANSLTVKRLTVVGALFVGFVSASNACDLVVFARQQASSGMPGSTLSQRALLDQYCVTCHSERIVHGEDVAPSPLVSQLRAVGLALDTLDLNTVGQQAEVWERVVRKVRGGMMPPAGRPRPDGVALDGLAGWLERELDRAALASPDPGRTVTLHRLNRAEYRNVVRDLLALEVDVDDLLPADESSRGFDNIGVALRLSESLMERYLAAAKTVSRLAVGSPPPAVVSNTYRIATDMQQHDRMDALPFGTRGGTLVPHLFPRDAEYEIQVEVGRARGGSRVPHRLEVTIDAEQVELARLGPPGTEEVPGTTLTAGALTVRVPVSAGPHDVGVTFYQNPRSLVEQVRDPFQNPRRGGVAGPIPIVSSVTIRGPYDERGAGDTPSRRRVFTCVPTTAFDERSCASEILTGLARRAYRRPATEADVSLLLTFYDDGRAAGNFETGIERALRYVLASPDYLFRVEADPVDVGVSGVSGRTPRSQSREALAARNSPRNRRAGPPPGLALANGLSYSDFYKSQTRTADRLRQLMRARWLATDGHHVDPSVCLDCFQTRPDQVRAAIERDERMVTAFAAERAP